MVATEEFLMPWVALVRSLDMGGVMGFWIMVAVLGGMWILFR